MDAFSYLGKSKFNDFSYTWPVALTPVNAVGPSRLPGILGNRHKLDKKMAAALSNTNIGTLGEGLFQVVRTDPTIADITKWQKGRPVFWVDITDVTKRFLVTTVAAVTSMLAGIALNTPDKAGDVVHICIQGDCEGLWAAASTKVVPVVGDPLQLKVAANLADLEVILDATSWTNVQIKAQVGKVIEVPANPAASGVKRILLQHAVQVFDEGIM